MSIKTLEPQNLWKNFDALNAVPRPSKKEERVITFAKNFGESLGLETVVDEIGNVIIKKPATPGMENRKKIVMQSHLDMVHQKNADTDFDFDTEGIRMIIDGDWVKADGTTLGADNGIGVATIMAVLESTDIPHPEMEALFTIDEETGMTGALELKPGLLQGDILLNLDTEDDNELTIGCAGGIDITASGSYTVKPMPQGNYRYMIMSVSGLSGGHSGMDIHKGLGNANKIMNRILRELIIPLDVKVNRIDGGGLRNAIPRESFCMLTVEELDYERFKKIIDEQAHIISEEYDYTDAELRIMHEDIDAFDSYIDSLWLKKFVKAIYACPSGIYRMHPEIEGLVQTSNNLARVLVQDGKAEALCLTRSSLETEKKDIMNAIQSIYELIDLNVSFSGNYPGWTPKRGAKIVRVMEGLYSEMFEGEMHVAACHAGLECGIIGKHYPKMEMVSFGPNIRGAHSPDERVQISSVQKFWNYLLAVLRNIPEK
jgi:dipeptidase D